MRSSTQDNAEGKLHQLKGKIKEVTGKVIMNPDLEAEGKDEIFCRENSRKDRQGQEVRWEVNIDFHKKILEALERRRTCFGPYL